VCRVHGVAEVLKTAEDAVGDAAQNIRTVATTMGVLFANRMGVFLLGVGLTGAWLPVIRGAANPVYLTMLGASCALTLWAASRGFGMRLRTDALPSKRMDLRSA
jgi:4-hydroxybenzoate polyprenyltransferase